MVKLPGEMGPIKLGTVAIDGTKLKAKASRHKAMRFERMQQAEEAQSADFCRPRSYPGKAPLARSNASSSSLQPLARTTLSECWPNTGAANGAGPGVRPNFSGRVTPR